MDIFEKIKNYVASHKKVSIAVLVLTLVSAICISSYVLSTNKQTVNNEKVTETTKNDSTVKKDDTKTSDEKKSDTKKDDKKEDKKSDTKVEETKATEVTDTNTSTNVSNNTSSTTAENKNTNTTSNTQPASTPCVPTYTTVNHPEQGHYESQLVMPAYDEPVYEMHMVGGQTGRIYNNTTEFANQEEDFSYAIKQVQVDIIHHDAEYNQVWVVDQQAWTETVASGC